MSTDDLFTSAQAAGYLRISDKTLRRWRDAKKGPAYKRTEDGRAIYTRASLDAWRATQFVATIIYAPTEAMTPINSNHEGSHV
jgi:hypothetical protein